MEEKNFTLTVGGKEFNTFYIKDRSHAISVLEAFSAKDREPVGFDLETVGRPEFRFDSSAPLDPLRSSPRLVQLGDGHNVLVVDTFFVGSLDFLCPFLSQRRLLAHNAIFEIQHLIHNFGLTEFNCGCTKIATRLIYDAIYPNSAAYPADLASVVKSLLKFELPKDIDHRCWGEPELTFEQVTYAASDAAVMPWLGEKLSNGLKRYGLERVYNLYKKAQYPLALMQLNGIKMNEPLHRELIAQWKVDAYQAKKELLTLTGLSDTNPKSMIQYLEETLPPDVLAIWPLTEKDEELSLSADTFSDFSFLPVVKPFSRFQKATKLSSTYGMKLLNKTNPQSKRIHCSYNLCGTRTGRLSSSDPNLQQLPRDKATRSLFIAPEGRKFVVADFNQIELRVAAEFSRDKMMLKSYRDGMDLHQITAEMLCGKRLTDLSEDEAGDARQAAKALNFGLLFGLGKKKFRHYAHKNYGAEMTEDEAFKAVSRWHELYSGYSEWHRRISQECKETLTVRTATGKLRALNEENYYGASANTPVQGSASEAMLSSLCRLAVRLGSRDSLINTVHDEIVIEIPSTQEDDERVKELVSECMMQGFKDIFPGGIVSSSLVKVKSGFNWSECK